MGFSRAVGDRSRPLALLVISALLCACTARVNVDVEATAPVNATQLWVTVEQVWFSTAADTLPSAGTGWIKRPLATPLALDLATLSTGTLARLATQLSLPTGTYRQVHLVIDDPAAALTGAASDAGLQYNAQVTTLDASTGVSSLAPLELPVPADGLTIPVQLTISIPLNAELSTSGAAASTSSTSTSSTASSTTATSSLVVSFDALRELLPYTHGTATGQLLSPVLSVADEAHAGGIHGSLDLSSLASGHAPVLVSAQTPDASGTHHVTVARALVDASGEFTLYPLPVALQGSTTYDVVISGADTTTLIIQQVPVKAGSITSAVALQNTAITLQAATPVYVDLATTATLLPGGARIGFYQTLPGAGQLPYLIDSTPVDPVTRHLPGDAFGLSSAPLLVGSYASGATILFATDSPAEGASAFKVASGGLYRQDTFASTPVVVAGSATAPTMLNAPLPQLAAGGTTAALSLQLSAPAGKYDSGFVTASVGGRIVEAASLASVLPGGGGTVTLAGMPAGAGLVATAGVPYALAVRAWKSSDTSNSVTVTSVSAISLGAGGTTTLTVTVP